MGKYSERHHQQVNAAPHSNTTQADDIKPGKLSTYSFYFFPGNLSDPDIVRAAKRNHYELHTILQKRDSQKTSENRRLIGTIAQCFKRKPQQAGSNLLRFIRILCHFCDKGEQKLMEWRWRLPLTNQAIRDAIITYLTENRHSSDVAEIIALMKTQPFFFDALALYYQHNKMPFAVLRLFGDDYLIKRVDLTRTELDNIIETFFASADKILSKADRSPVNSQQCDMILRDLLFIIDPRLANKSTELATKLDPLNNQHYINTHTLVRFLNHCIHNKSLAFAQLTHQQAKQLFKMLLNNNDIVSYILNCDAIKQSTSLSHLLVEKFNQHKGKWPYSLDDPYAIFFSALEPSVLLDVCEDKYTSKTASFVPATAIANSILDLPVNKKSLRDKLIDTFTRNTTNAYWKNLDDETLWSKLLVLEMRQPSDGPIKKSLLNYSQHKNCQRKWLMKVRHIAENLNTPSSSASRKSSFNLSFLNAVSDTKPSAAAKKLDFSKTEVTFKNVFLNKEDAKICFDYISAIGENARRCKELLIANKANRKSVLYITIDTIYSSCNNYEDCLDNLFTEPEYEARAAFDDDQPNWSEISLDRSSFADLSYVEENSIVTMSPQLKDYVSDQYMEIPDTAVRYLAPDEKTHYLPEALLNQQTFSPLDPNKQKQAKTTFQRRARHIESMPSFDNIFTISSPSLNELITSLRDSKPTWEEIPKVQELANAICETATFLEEDFPMFYNNAWEGRNSNLATAP